MGPGHPTGPHRGDAQSVDTIPGWCWRAPGGNAPPPLSELTSALRPGDLNLREDVPRAFEAEVDVPGEAASCDWMWRATRCGGSGATTAAAGYRGLSSLTAGGALRRDSMKPLAASGRAQLERAQAVALQLEVELGATPGGRARAAYTALEEARSSLLDMHFQPASARPSQSPGRSRRSPRATDSQGDRRPRWRHPLPLA